MNRHSRPHSSRSTPQTSSELWGMGGPGGCNMQAQTQHMARVPSRFDSYLEARSGLARDAHATTFHPTGAAVDAVSSYGPLQRHLAAGQRLREGGHARAWTRRSCTSAAVFQRDGEGTGVRATQSDWRRGTGSKLSTRLPLLSGPECGCGCVQCSTYATADAKHSR